MEWILVVWVAAGSAITHSAYNSHAECAAAAASMAKYLTNTRMDCIGHVKRTNHE